MTLPKTSLITLLVFTIGYCLPAGKAGLVAIPSAFAAEYQSCPLDASCTVGEFLFDDNYTPIATASCTLTSRNPTGTLFLNNQNLSGTSDGWYAHTFATASQSAGLYRSQICCTVDSDYLCLDKSFTLNASASALTSTDVSNAVWNATPSAHTTPGTYGATYLTASDVWNYANRNLTDFGDLVTSIWSNPTRTLSGFGTLITDIWAYSSRSLSSFGTLVSSIWTHTDRSLTQDVETDTSGLASKTDVAYLKTEIDKITASGGLDYQNKALLQTIATQVVENRDLLDALVNQPIISSFIEEGDTPDLLSKINRTQQAAEALYALNQQLHSRTGLIVLKWDTLPTSSINSELASLIQLLGDPKSPTSIDTHLAWLKDAWGSTPADHLQNLITTLRTNLHTAQDQLATNPGNTQLQLQQAVDTMDQLAQTIGDVTSTPEDPSLYGKLKQVQILAQSLDANDQTLNTLLAAWNQQPPLERDRQITKLSQNIMQINRLTDAANLLTNHTSKPEDLAKNQVLGLRAINQINRSLLAVMQGKPVKGLWLEEGSVIFRTLVTNPSERITQTVPLNYYLPKEVKLENVIKADPALKVEYNPTYGALAASATVTLEPGETRVYAIEVTDIWKINADEIASLQKQAGELLKPLEKTTYFGQGATLKSDLDVLFTKILANLKVNRPPDDRIRFYRESQLELAGAQTKLEAMKTLVATAGSATAAIGFMGGTQLLATLAIILVIIAACAFMLVYLRMLRAQTLGQPLSPPAESPRYALPLHLPFSPHPAPARIHADHRRPNPRAIRSTRTFMILVVILSSAIFTLTMLNLRSTRLLASKPPSTQILGSSTSPTPTPIPLTPGTPVTVVIPPRAHIPVLENPNRNADSYIELDTTLKATLLQTQNGWAQIDFTLDNTPVIGWIPQGLLVPIKP